MQRTALLLMLAAFALLFPTVAAAQTTSVSGQVLKSDGTPWTNLDVNILNTETGEHYAITTDKDGRYSQQGLRPGIYKVSLVDKNDSSFAYSETHFLHGAAENDVSIIFSKQASLAHAHSGSTDEEDAARFDAVKAHFNAGAGAMREAEELRSQLAAAPPDRKADIQPKLASDYQTAIEEFQLAEQADPRLDAKTHAMILSNLGNAFDFSGDADSAIVFYEKGIALSPDAVEYQNLAKLQASRAIRDATSHNAPPHLAAADDSCTSAAALDPLIGAKCWKNLGIILANSGNPSDAATACRKSTALNPNDAQTWFQLGQALLRMVEYKHEGNEVIPIFPADAADALQKCIAADPTGPYSTQAKQLLAELASTKSTASSPTSNSTK